MSKIETIDTISDADSSRTAGTYNVSSFSTNGNGTGAVFTVTVNGSGAASVSITTKGSRYAVDDIITIADSQLGNGGGPSLTFNIDTISA